jgi:hypothetical protein
MATAITSQIASRSEWLVLLALVLTPSTVRAEDNASCFGAAEAGQSLRDEGKYAEARAKFTECSRDPCPAVVQHDCSAWLERLIDIWPTVVVRADVNGADVAEVHVSIDGKRVSDRLDGRPILVEPGEHTLRCETAGQPAKEERLVVTSGEKNRIVNVHFTRATAAPEHHSSIALPLGFVFGGLALVGIGIDAYAGGTALSSYNTMKATCAATLPGTCNPQDVRDVQTRFLVGDVALGIGIASAVVATVFFIVAASHPKAATHTALLRWTF